MKLYTLILLLSSSAFSHASKKITFITIDYCPLICDSKNLPGIMPEMTKKIFESEGYKVEISIIASLDRAIKEVEEGNFDGLIAGSKKHMPQFIFPEIAILPQPVQLFSRTELKWKYKGAGSLANIQLGAIKSYDYVNKVINKHVKAGKNVTMIDQTNSAKRLLKMIELKRIDAWVAGSYVAKYYINKLGLKKIISPSSKALGSYYNSISFSPKNTNAKKYAQIVDKGMKKLYSKGQLKKLLLKYGIN